MGHIYSPNVFFIFGNENGLSDFCTVPLCSKVLPSIFLTIVQHHFCNQDYDWRNEIPPRQQSAYSKLELSESHLPTSRRVLFLGVCGVQYFSLYSETYASKNCVQHLPYQVYLSPCNKDMRVPNILIIWSWKSVKWDCSGLVCTWQKQVCFEKEIVVFHSFECG